MEWINENNLDNAFNITPTEVEVDESDVVVGVDREKPDRLTKDDITKTMNIQVVIFFIAS